MYAVFDKVYKQHGEDGTLTKTQQRVIEKYLQNFKRNGASLKYPDKESVQVINNKISGIFVFSHSQNCSELSIEFLKNCNEDNSFILASKEELEGMPEEFFKRLEKNQVGSVASS